MGRGRGDLDGVGRLLGVGSSVGCPVERVVGVGAAVVDAAPGWVVEGAVGMGGLDPGAAVAVGVGMLVDLAVADAVVVVAVEVAAGVSCSAAA